MGSRMTTRSDAREGRLYRRLAWATLLGTTLSCANEEDAATTVRDAATTAPSESSAGGASSDTEPDVTVPEQDATSVGAPEAETTASNDASAADATVDASAGEPSDAEPSDAPSSAGCTHPLCEDFESGQVDPGKWTVATSGGHTMMIQGTQVAHGHYAALFHAPAKATGYDFIIAKNGPSQLKVHHFGRAYVYVAPKLPMGHTGLMFAGSSGFPKLKYLEVAGVQGGWQLTYVNLTGASAGETYFLIGCPGNRLCVPTLQMPVGTWTCIEWEFNDQPDQIAVTVDGKPTAMASPIQFGNATTDLVGGFTDFGFGFYDWHPDAYAFDVYYDDIALDTQPIGCL